MKLQKVPINYVTLCVSLENVHAGKMIKKKWVVA